VQQKCSRKEKAKRATHNQPKIYQQPIESNRMRIKKSRTATLDEVIISKDGEYAVIDFREPGISGMNMKLGPKDIAPRFFRLDMDGKFARELDSPRMKEIKILPEDLWQ
jgi:hypothetical protein